MEKTGCTCISDLLRASKKQKSLLSKIKCKGCGKDFLTNRDSEYCFDCEKKMKED